MDNHDFLLTSSQSSQQYSACLWDYKTKNILKFYKNGGTIISKTLDIVEKSYILSAETAKPILHVWPLNSQEIDKNIKLILPGVATCLAVDPKNNYLMVAVDIKLYVWQIASGKLLSVQQRHYQPITCIKCSSNGEHVAVSGEDGILVVYYLADLIAIHNSLLNQSIIGQVEPKYTKNDHTMPITDMHIGVFGRKARITTCSADQTACLYALSTGELLLKLVFHEPLTSILFDAPCWKLYVGGNTGSIVQFNLKNPPRRLIHHVERKSSNSFVGHKGKIVALALNFNNSILASGSHDNFVFTWEISSMQVLQKFEHKAPITNLKFIPNFSNIFEQNFKPHIVLKPLERSIDHDSNDFTISKMQYEDIELSDDENGMEQKLYRKKIEDENIKLRIVNNELYRTALLISQKFNLNGGKK